MLANIRYIGLFICLGVVSAQAHVDSAPSSPNANAQVDEPFNPDTFRGRLTGEQIVAALVGNTIVGSDEDGHFAEYLDRSGMIKGLGDAGRYSGAWRVSGDQICFYYYDLDPKDPRANKWDCNAASLSNGNIYWSEELSDDDVVDASLVKGNPKGL